MSPFVDHLLFKLTPCKWYETTCLLQVVFIKSKVDLNVYIKQAHEIFFFLGGVGTHTKEPMGLFYKRTMNIFSSFFTFSYERIFE
jgi:hypothetical protein